MEKLVKQILEKYFGKKLVINWPGNLALKVVALFFAVFLWYFVVGEDKVDVTVYVPVEIINLPRDLVISNQFKKQLEVTVSGPRGLTRSITRQHITRPVDLSGVKPGTEVVKNTAESIPFPRGIKIQRVQPASITLLVDRLIEKELAIKPTIVGKLPQGYELVSTTLEPSTITLNAPEAVLSDEVFLSTNEIDITGLTETTQKQITLNLKPAIADLLGESAVTANIVIQEKMVEKLIKGIELEFSHSADRTTYRLHPTKVDIRAELPFSIAKKNGEMAIPLFKPKVDAGSLPPGRHMLKVLVTPSSQTKVLEVMPPEVEIDISQEQPLLKRKPEPDSAINQ